MNYTTDAITMWNHTAFKVPLDVHMLECSTFDFLMLCEHDLPTHVDTTPQIDNRHHHYHRYHYMRCLWHEITSLFLAVNSSIIRCLFTRNIPDSLCLCLSVWLVVVVFVSVVFDVQDASFHFCCGPLLDGTLEWKHHCVIESKWQSIPEWRWQNVIACKWQPDGVEVTGYARMEVAEHTWSDRVR